MSVKSVGTHGCGPLQHRFSRTSATMALLVITKPGSSWPRNQTDATLVHASAKDTFLRSRLPGQEAVTNRVGRHQ